MVASTASAQGATSQRATQNAPAYRFDIPAGPLDGALGAFERTTGLKVAVADTGIRGLQSPGASGSYTAEQAMTQLLTGLSVNATFDATTVSLRVRPVNEFVEVSGTVPRTAQSPKYRDEIRDTPQEILVIRSRSSRNRTRRRCVMCCVTRRASR